VVRLITLYGHFPPEVLDGEVGAVGGVVGELDADAPGVDVVMPSLE
jgi:hypothetical protein